MPFLAELALRTLMRVVVLSLVLPLLVVAIDQTTGSGSLSGPAWLRWWQELAALAVALAVVDTVAGMEGGQALGAASIGVSRRRWLLAILLPAALFAALTTAVRLSHVGVAPTPATIVVAERAELERVAAATCAVPAPAPELAVQAVSVGPDTRRLRAWTEPWLGLLVALAALWLAPRTTRAVGLGAELGRTRAVALVATLFVATVATAAWRVALAMIP